MEGYFLFLPTSLISACISEIPALDLIGSLENIPDIRSKFSSPAKPDMIRNKINNP
jgi:hypothetical protein